MGDGLGKPVIALFKSPVRENLKGEDSRRFELANFKADFEKRIRTSKRHEASGIEKQIIKQCSKMNSWSLYTDIEDGREVKPKFCSDEQCASKPEK
jgi:hypothetical protein